MNAMAISAAHERRDGAAEDYFLTEERVPPGIEVGPPAPPFLLDGLPEVPPLAQFLPGYEAAGWSGLCAPRQTPAAIVALLNREVNAALADPKIKERLEDLGGVPKPMSAADFAKFIAGETDKWAKVVKFANIKMD